MANLIVDLVSSRLLDGLDATNVHNWSLLRLGTPKKEFKISLKINMALVDDRWLKRKKEDGENKYQEFGRVYKNMTVVPIINRVLGIFPNIRVRDIG